MYTWCVGQNFNTDRLQARHHARRQARRQARRDAQRVSLFTILLAAFGL